MAVKAYLDSSGKSSDSFVTLAAFAANDATWADFEFGWNQVLASGFRRVPYMHMKEAVHRGYGSPFSHTAGWSREHIWDLVFKLATYMSQFKGGLLTMHSCEIDMNAWRRLIAEGYAVPSEVDLCNQYVSEFIAGLFSKQILDASQSQILNLHCGDLLNFIFDRNEPYFEPFLEKVDYEKRKAKQSGRSSMWQLVDCITEGEVKTTPGLQAADVLAWGLNRQNTAPEGREGKYLAHILKQVVFCTWKEFDEATLRNKFAV